MLEKLFKEGSKLSFDELVNRANSISKTNCDAGEFSLGNIMQHDRNVYSWDNDKIDITFSVEDEDEVGALYEEIVTIINAQYL